MEEALWCPGMSVQHSPRVSGGEDAPNLELELSNHRAVGKEVFTVTREQQRAGVCQNYNTYGVCFH